MSENEFPKTYDFGATEQQLYNWWEESGWFRPTNDPSEPGFDPARKPFVISIPPPNVTGELHLGHAMFVSMEDLMIRYHRMKGYSALWVPGSDHAGIATQLQVEKALAKEKIKQGALVVDVRSADEFADGHYADAKNIPVSEIARRAEELGDKNRPVVVYCAAGVRAAKAKAILLNAGFKDVTNAGGLSDLQN